MPHGLIPISIGIITFLIASNDHLIDIPASLITISNLPASPDGKVIDGIDVIVRLSDKQ